MALVGPRPQIALLNTPRREAVETPMGEDIDKLGTFSVPAVGADINEAAEHSPSCPRKSAWIWSRSASGRD